MDSNISLSDQENSEVIKKWWRENYRIILIGILVSSITFLAARSWIIHRYSRSIEASTLYQLVVNTVAAPQNDAEIYNSARRIKESYSDTPYGLFSALILAKEDEKQGDLKTALSHLEWALKHTKEKDSEFREIIYLRIARLLLADNQLDNALNALENINSKNLTASYAEEIRGDIYLKLGKIKEAKEAYQEGLQNLKLETQHQQIIKLKLKDIEQS
ncbi:YfgM family protein [Candidatus Nitrosacidococcus tergens]|uniref:Ancillary SecYEG translocon subunit n=1 Tax=Candidatus Nitrosacidococcus tergens TaxID=553981 RepID=A0A7G1Q8A0_9GAMM|nr:tetratricopeptide repeat protein [Candidatus Nitrosacidococcus tergens]CAB1274924.1 conserved protein of unknown function [Candidatus Nitrosacidococcus tergens]